ncbi:carboxylesterase/lipase family protein [Phenylobacterium sp.]|jgi:para-nitrobenzyl esterase|uniref:carboxylesterase/lipase family protein n=1 Tax=Phenylobacterium sp. TaxID=1871053 RepID=UPI002F410325
MLRRLLPITLPMTLAIAAALFATNAARAADAPTVVAIDTGKVQGAVKAGVLSFKGIPFAAQPVGDLRWRPPQPAPRWSGVKAATAFGHDCLQGIVRNDPGMGTDLGEDCLNVNVWRPAAVSPKKLPVMVWFYGGGLVNGGTQPEIYQGDNFARDGVVFVSVSYRLGRFGFFAFPALSAERPDELKGNYGYMDQLAALKWVQRNIAAFGGDPRQVTIFGESAGGFSVHTLVASPLAKGLFERAIVESGGGRTAEGPAPALASAETQGLAFARSVGVDGADAAALAKLRALPADKVTGNLTMYTAAANAPIYSGPITDGKLVVETPEQAYRAGRQNKVALIAGANGADLGFNAAKTMDELIAPFGAKKAAALAAYDPQGTGALPAARAKVGMDQLMLEPARFDVRTFAAQGLPAWEFRFDYVGDALHARAPNGAPHASEIPFVFDKYGQIYIGIVSPTHSGSPTALDSQVARTAHGYWVNFAKTGDPNGPGLPPWPRYSAAKDELMIFQRDGTAKAQPDPLKARMDLTAAIQP